ITGNDNPGENVDPDEEPGNQMAGWDVRWASPFGAGPWAVYWHEIGEDESGRRPIFRLKQAGVEVWGGAESGGAWRAHAEWADTNPACAEGSSGCAYRGGPYDVEGYSYFERSLGHPMFYNSEMISAGLHVTTAVGDRYSGLVRWADINQRESGRFHTVASDNVELWNLELGYETDRQIGTIRAGVGVDHGERADGTSYLAGRGFIELRRQF
ncbi:MAG TPA: capsule assembly Wzi family protein, partial [Steroidobacteraceae bacterium]|nr:capsule assembly Wzi family protein [Steroidobacteraceae bacterium]